MKLKELSFKVINYLKKTKRPKSAIEITKGVNLPLEKKRRIYDILDVLTATNSVKIFRKGNEKLVNWIGENNNEEEIIEIKNTSVLEDKQYCLLNVDLIFSSSEYKTLKNSTWQDMMLRDIKRQVKGLIDLKLKDIKLIETNKLII